MNWGWGNIVLRSAAGGRDEETYSKYARGVRVKVASELEAAQATCAFGRKKSLILDSRFS